MEAVCRLLDVPLPTKPKKAKKGDAKQLEEKSSQPAEKPSSADVEMLEPDEDLDETDFEGFATDVDEPGPAVGEADSEAEGVEEAELAKYDDLLGSSSEEDSEEELDESRYEKYRGKEQVNLDDISISSGSNSDVEDEIEPEIDQEMDPEGDSEDGSEDDSEDSAPPLSPPKKAKAKSTKSSKSKSSSAPIRSSTFLPSLMGGYISGSESDASSIDVAPAKKRLGQRQRQAIWEKKYGGSAKHLHQPQKSAWDARRGAVDANDRKPWKKGIANPFARRGDAEDGFLDAAPSKKPAKRDDEGTLHASWEARKKAKEAEKTATFAGSKIVFD